MYISEFFIILIIIILFGLITKLILKNNLYFDFILSFLIIWILFVNVNPYTPNQNKFTILSFIPNQYTPKQFLLSENDIIYKIKYPVIFKPIRCTRCSKDVSVINNIDEAKKYISDDINFNLNEIMIQEFVPYTNEVGILFERNLFDNSGKIKSMFKRTLDNNLIVNIGSDSNKNNSKDLTHLVTPELNNIILKISNSIPDFNVGRYDIKYKDFESLLQGKDFYILEANGTMGFNLSKNTGNIFTGTLKTIDYALYRIMYGFKNIITLNGYNPLELINILVMCLYNAIDCMDWEKLFAIYS